MHESLPEKQKEVLDDNARKFIIGTVEPKLLESDAASTYLMTTDWLETGEDDETKLVYKRFDSGDTQILLIAKTTVDGSRTSQKEKISEEKYKELLKSSMLHVEKRRTEFDYEQNDIVFAMKYDEFANGLQILEVDAPTEEERNAFDSSDFPAETNEVTGDLRYYGYRIAGVLGQIES